MTPTVRRAVAGIQWTCDACQDLHDAVVSFHPVGDEVHICAGCLRAGLAAIETTEPTPIVAGSRWKHHRTGNVYFVIGEAALKVDGKWRDGIIYRALDGGDVFGRAVEDFRASFAPATTPG